MARAGLTVHRKFRRLVFLLEGAFPKRVPVPYEVIARGILEQLWTAAEKQRDPVMTTATDVAAHCWTGQAAKICSILVEAGFLDQYHDRYEVHDFWDHAPRHIRRTRRAQKDTLGAEAAEEAESDDAEKADRLLTGYDASKKPNTPQKADRPLTGYDGSDAEVSLYSGENTYVGGSPSRVEGVQGEEGSPGEPHFPISRRGLVDLWPEDPPEFWPGGVDFRPAKGIEKFDLPYHSGVFLCAFSLWVSARREKRAPIAPGTVAWKRHRHRMVQWGEGVSVSALVNSIGYQGLFPPAQRRRLSPRKSGGQLTEAERRSFDDG